VVSVLRSGGDKLALGPQDNETRQVSNLQSLPSFAVIDVAAERPPAFFAVAQRPEVRESSHHGNPGGRPTGASNV
jgi:hypothetical protein